MNSSLKKMMLVPAALGMAAAIGTATHLTAPSHPVQTGQVTGFYFSEGGVAPGNIQYPLTGTVTLTPEHGRAITAKVGKDGKFSVVVPDGTYLVRATPTRAEGDCSPSATTYVATNQTSNVSLGCYIP